MQVNFFNLKILVFYVALILSQLLWAYVTAGHWQPRLLPLLMDLTCRLYPDELSSTQAARLGEADAGIVQLIPGLGV